MFTFFKISIHFAVTALFALSLITFSDVFIHTNQLRFYVLTIIAAMIFFVMGLAVIFVYKNLEIIKIGHVCILKEDKKKAVQAAVRKLLLIFGFAAIIIAFFTCSLCVALLQRMNDGMALFG